MRVFGRIKVHTPLNGRVAVHRRAVQLSVGDLKRAFLRQPAFVVTVAVKIPLVGLYGRKVGKLRFGRRRDFDFGR